MTGFYKGTYSLTSGRVGWCFSKTLPLMYILLCTAYVHTSLTRELVLSEGKLLKLNQRSQLHGDGPCTRDAAMRKHDRLLVSFLEHVDDLLTHSVGGTHALERRRISFFFAAEVYYFLVPLQVPSRRSWESSRH